MAASSMFSIDIFLIDSKLITAFILYWLPEWGFEHPIASEAFPCG
jgi:hypothetical protein